jgi:hypothetical protein
MDNKRRVYEDKSKPLKFTESMKIFNEVMKGSNNNILQGNNEGIRS